SWILRQRDRANEGVVTCVRIAQLEVPPEEMRDLGHSAIAEHLHQLRAHLLVALGLVVALVNAEAIAQDARDERVAARAGHGAPAIDARPPGSPRRLPREQARQPFGDEARLARPLRADDGDELRRLVLYGAREDRVELRNFVLASD